MVLPTVLHLPCIITSFLVFRAKSQYNISGIVCAVGETARAHTMGVAVGKY